MNKTLKRVIITVVSLVTAAAVGVGAFSIVKKNQKQNLTAQVTPVSMMYTQYYEDNYRYGYVQSGFTQNVFAQEGAVIQEIYVQQGQEVKTGDPLLTYDPEQIQLELDRKELNIQVLQRRYERLLNELYELQNTKPSDASSLYGASAGNGMTASLRDETTPGESSASEESSKAEESSVQEESSESKLEESSESKLEESSESKPEESSESKPEESSESKSEESSESKPEESSESKPEESSESKPEESSESKPEESSESKPEESSESKPEESSESKPEESSGSKPEESSESKPEESSESKPEESSESKPEESSESKPEESSEPEPYTASGSCTVKGVFSLVGRDIKAGEFTVQVTDANGKTAATAVNDAAGNFSFTLIYDQDAVAGSPYVYTVQQTAAAADGMIYDENVYTMTVRIQDNKDGKLTVTATGAENMRFTNVYSKTSEYEEQKEDRPIPVLTASSKPYTGKGTEQEPYRYWIGRNTKLISTFCDAYISTDGENNSQDPKEATYFIFDKRKNDEPDGEIEYSWYLSTDGLEKDEKVRVYNLSVYQIPLDPQSYLLAVAENALPKTMNLSINMIDRDINVKSVTIVGEDVLEEAELDHSYFNVLLAKGGIFNLYLQYKEDDPDESSGESSEESIPDEPEPYIPDYPVGPTGPTREELLQKIKEKEVEIKDMEVTQKMADLDLEKTREKLENVVVKSIVNGRVTRVDPMGGNYNEPVVQIIGGDEIYVSTTVSELDLGKVQVGDPVTAISWMTGEQMEGVVSQIGDYPVEDAMGYYSQNPNVSNYEMIIAFPADSGLMDGQGVELTMGSMQPPDAVSFCIPSMYIRDENGSYYVLADQDGYLVKKYIQVGRSMYDGEYIEILGGITMEDYLAFPYGKAAQEGVKTVYDEILYQ